MASAASASLPGVWGSASVRSRDKAPSWGSKGFAHKASDIPLNKDIFLQIECIFNKKSINKLN